MKIKDIKRIIQEEVEKQRGEIEQLVIDALETPEVDVEKKIKDGDLPEDHEEDVVDAIKSLKEGNELAGWIQEALKEGGF